MEATLTLSLTLNEKQLKKFMKNMEYPDDFEPIDVKEALELWDQKQLNEIFQELRISFYWTHGVEVKEQNNKLG